MTSQLHFSKSFFFAVIFITLMMNHQFWRMATSAEEDEKSRENRERWNRLKQQPHLTPITCPTGMKTSGNTCVCPSFQTNVNGKCV